MRYPHKCVTRKRLGDGEAISFCWLLLLAVAVLTPLSAHGFWPLADPPAEKIAAAPPLAMPPPASEIAVLEEKIGELAATLVRHLAGADPAVSGLDDGLVVCTFVELGKLTRSSSFGRYLADRLMNSLQQSEYRVVELRKTRDVLIQENHGEHGLSRDPARLPAEVTAGASLTGTYTETPEHVLVNARIVNNRDATVLSSATVIFPRNAPVSHLLADRSSLSTKQQRAQVVYMKKLTR